MVASVPHSCAALETRTRHVPDQSGDICEVLRCAEACATVAFEPLEYPREEDSHAYSVSTKEELLDWVKNGNQTYRDLLVPVCVLASSPSSAFRYKSYADFSFIILDFCIAAAPVWPQNSANRSLIQVGLIRPGRNLFNTNVLAISTNPYATACAPRRPVRHLALLHTLRILHTP
ncbi:hypothetical protein EDB85DRAFT_1900942 [Lactarius pseudohatsudake]|nr:hypothetical protein EDB85DRAFT_1900942 [Lactarius pseudohatsudake]